MQGQVSNDRRTVEAVLAVDGFKARVDYLLTRPESHSPELVAAFLSRANREMRRDPRESAQCARLARLVANKTRNDAPRVTVTR